MKKIIPIISIITLLFLFAIAIDLSPFLRGPAPYSPDWRWPHQIPVLTWRLIVPFLSGGLILITGMLVLKKEIKNIWWILALLIFEGLVLQLSLLFASTAGISVIIHRMINPMISGYFTTATYITTVPEFLKTFNDSFNYYPLFARFHPPLDVLFYYYINQLALFITPFMPFINSVDPTHGDVSHTWNSLFAYEKIGAILGALITQLLSFATIIPLYFAAKNLSNQKSGIIACLLYILTPSILLFAPLTDVMYPLFIATSFYFLTQFLNSKKPYWLYLSGLILSIGSLFTLTILPVLLVFGIYYLFQIDNLYSKIKLILGDGTIILAGFLTPLIILQLFFHLDILTMLQRVKLYHDLTQIGRNYFVWFFYSPYDFFIFLGIPTTILFLTSFLKRILSRESALAISFSILILILLLLGSVKGETGRVWIPYIIFPIIATAVSLKKLGSNQTIFMLLLLLLQSIIFGLFLVTLW